MTNSENPFDDISVEDTYDEVDDLTDISMQGHKTPKKIDNPFNNGQFKVSEPKIKQAPVDDQILSILNMLNSDMDDMESELSISDKEPEIPVESKKSVTIADIDQPPTTPQQKAPHSNPHTPINIPPSPVFRKPNQSATKLSHLRKPLEDVKLGNKVSFWLLQVISDDEGNLVLLGKTSKHAQSSDFVNATIKIIKPRFTIHFIPSSQKIFEDKQDRSTFKAACFDLLAEIIGKLAVNTLQTEFVTKENCFGNSQGSIIVLEASFTPCVNSKQRGVYDIKNVYKNLRLTANAIMCGTHSKSNVISDIRGVSDSVDTQFLLKHNICGPTWINIDIPEDKSIARANAGASEICVTIPEDRFTFTPIVDPLYTVLPRLNYTFIEPFYENGSIVKLALAHYSSVSKGFTNPTYQHVFDIRGKVNDIKENAPFNLANELINYIDELQTDVIVGYEISKTIDYITARAPKNYKLSRTPFIYNQRSKIIRTAGRITIDLLNALNEFESNENTNVSAIINANLGVEYTHSFESLAELPDLIAKILAKKDYFNLYLSISEITTKPFPEITLYGRETRIVALLMNKMHNMNHLLPNNKIETNKRGSSGEKAQYAGGLVLDPIPGLSDNIVLVLDYNSLYPSIIREFNLCFTTRNGNTNLDDIDSEASRLFSSEKLPIDQIQTAIIPSIVTNLIMERKKYRQPGPENETVEQKAVKNVKQLAFKICVNSLYGTLGSDHNRFTAKHIASLITAIGRLCLKHAKECASSLGYTVLYGDTDSIMVDTGTKEKAAAEAVVSKVCAAVNERFNYLELDNDDVFEKALFIQKKSYAYKNKEGIKFKGIAAVRRDHAGALKPLTYKILATLFMDSSDKFQRCISLISREMERIRSGNNLDNFIIRKDLGFSTANAVNSEKKDSSQDHVIAAIKQRQAFNQSFTDGDRIEYVVSQGEGRRQDRCIPVKLVDDSFVPDMKYYQQDLFNAIKTLLVNIEGYSEYDLKKAFGIQDNSIMKMSEINEEALFDPYRKFERIELTCKNCQKVNTWPVSNAQDLRLFESFTIKCECGGDVCDVMNGLTNSVYEKVQKLIHQLHTGRDPDEILQEIEFLSKLFDETKEVYINKEIDPKFSLDAQFCRHIIENLANSYSYAMVDLGQVFSILALK